MALAIIHCRGFPPIAGEFIIDNLSKMDDLRVLLFQETLTCMQTCFVYQPSAGLHQTYWWSSNGLLTLWCGSIPTKSATKQKSESGFWMVLAHRVKDHAYSYSIFYTSQPCRDLSIFVSCRFFYHVALPPFSFDMIPPGVLVFTAGAHNLRGVEVRYNWANVLTLFWSFL